MNSLVEHEIDVVVAGLAMRESRFKVIDFTIPIEESGIVFLARKPDTSSNNIFSFLIPLSSTVWMLTAGSFAFVVLILIVFNYFHKHDSSIRSPFNITLYLFGLHDDGIPRYCV